MANLKIKNIANKADALKAVQNNGYTYFNLQPEHQTDLEIIMAAVHDTPSIFKRINEEYRQNKKVVLTAVKKMGTNLQYVPNFQNNREIVLAAVKSSGIALQYAPIWNDELEIVSEAITNNPAAYQYISNSLKYEKELALLAIARTFHEHETFNSSMIYSLFSENFQNDEDIIINLLKKNKNNWYSVPEKWQKNEELALKAILINPDFLEVFSLDFKNNIKIIYYYLKETLNRYEEDPEYYQDILNPISLKKQFPTVFNKVSNLEEFFSFYENQYLKETIPITENQNKKYKL